MSLNPLKTKHPLISLILTILLCAFLGAIIGLLFFEQEKYGLEQLNVDFYAMIYGEIIPMYTVLGGLIGVVVGLIIGMFGYVINKNNKQIETIKLVGK